MTDGFFLRFFEWPRVKRERRRRKDVGRQGPSVYEDMRTAAQCMQLAWLPEALPSP
jgi:hypothetical protein